MKNIEIKKGTVLYANTGVAVKVLEYSSKFGGRVLVERADGIEGGKPMWRPLDKFSETNPYPQKNKGGKVDNKNITDFINGYKMGILFTETDEEGENLDANYNPSNFDSKSDEIISKMAHQYIDENGASIILSKLSYEQIGTDVWFAQSGQGAGFFDRNLDKNIEENLTRGAKKFSDLSTYVFAQDGKVYIEGLKFEKGGHLTGGEWKKGTTIKFKTKKQAQERLDLMKGEDGIRNPRIEKIWDKPFVDRINDGYVVKFEYLKTDKYAKGSTVRANKSSLLKYVNFEDNWHINLLELDSNRNNNGLKYKNKNQYAVVRSTKEKGQEVFEFKTLIEAEERFEKLVEKSKTYSKVISEGKTNNYEKGGNMPKSFEYSIGGL